MTFFELEAIEVAIIDGPEILEFLLTIALNVVCLLVVIDHIAKAAHRADGKLERRKRRRRRTNMNGVVSLD